MAKKTPPESAEPARTRLDQILDAAEAAYVQGGAPPEAPATPWWPDPVAALVNRGAAQLPTGTPDWLRWVGRAAIPQNAPEAALAVGMLPFGGPLAARGVPLAAKLAAKGVGPAIKRAIATGLGTGAVGAVTGHDLLPSIATGLVGRPVGETVGVGAGKLVQRAVSNRLFQDASGKLANVFRDVIGPYLPDKATDATVLREVVSDNASKKVGAAMNAAKARLAEKPVKALDLKPVTDANGVTTYAWPTEAGPGPTGVGPGAPTVQGGNVWPPPRTFESKLTPGEELIPYGAVESSPRRIGAGEGGKPMVPSDAVPFGALWDKVDEVYQATELAVREGNTDLVPRLEALKKVRQTLVDRTGDPELKNLFKDYGVTKSLRDLFWGKRGAPAAFGEDVVKDLVDEQTGLLTPKGVQVVFDRLNTDAPNIARQVGEATTQKLADALGIQPEKGLASPVPGQWPTLRFHPGVGGLHPTVSPEGARVGNYPGWEGERSALQTLVPDALKVLGGQVPKVMLPETPPASAEEGPPRGEGVSIPPARLKDPYAGAGALTAPVAAPAPPKLPSPEASAPQAGLQGAGWFPRFNEADADQPEVTLEVTKKPGE